jgi:FixJ family two-component response regulator/AraC-like DNA-binding protein
MSLNINARIHDESSPGPRPSLVSSGEKEGSRAPIAQRKADSDSRSVQPRLLWIDDEISSSNIEVQFLESQGFRIDCAVAGCDGLDRARAVSYDGILLDLRLPDLPGLAILATLRGEGITTPVLVLTGFADWEAARVAGRFGAGGFKAKPIFVDELEIAVRQLVEMSTSGSEEPNDENDEVRAGLIVLATLLERLHRFSRKGLSTAARNDLDTSDKSEPLQTVAIELMRALVNPTLPMVAFLACSAALRRSMTADRVHSLGTLGLETQDLILEALAKPGLVDPRVAAAIDSAKSGAARRQRPMIETIAEERHISASHLGRLVKEQTGFDFTDWRTAFILRPSVSALLETNQDVKQIACGRLGFKHLSQFDHEFHRFFGLTPTQFRQFKPARRS